jgi:hypothetical protein
VMESILFNIPWQRLLRESLRRLVRIKHAMEPGGQQAMEFKKLCKEEGIPDEALEQIDYEGTMAVRGLGNGSPQARMFTTSAMKDYVPFMDEEGRANWVRDGIAALPGVDWTQVDRYAPEYADMRPSQQVRNALEENVNLKMIGMVADERVLSVEDVPVLPNDDHITHLETQTPAMEKIVGQVDEGALLMEEAVRPLFPLYIHCTQHIEACLDNPILKDQLAAFRRAMHNVGEIITNGQRKLQAQEEKAQENYAKGLDADGNPLPGAEGEEGGERPIFQSPLGDGQMLTASEYQLVAKAQVHLSDAARNAARADEIHEMRVNSMRGDSLAREQDARNRTLESAQKRQLSQLKAVVDIRAKAQQKRKKKQPA